MTNHVDRLPGFLLQKDRFKKGKQKTKHSVNNRMFGSVGIIMLSLRLYFRFNIFDGECIKTKIIV